MKLLTGKGIKQKIIIAIVIVMLFNFIMPNVTRAGVENALLEPVKDLVVSVTDGLVWLLQYMFLGDNTTLIKLSNDTTEIADSVGSIAGTATGVGIAALLIGTGPVGWIVGGIAGAYVAHQLTNAIFPPTFYLPVFGVSPEEIFQNKIAALDVNFFESVEDKEDNGATIRGEDTDGDGNPDKYYVETTTVTGQTISQQSSALVLKSTIAKWYNALRNLAIIILLCILVYTGIRIIISSSGKDKAKYKERLMDWLVAMCLLFFMHYIMAFAVTIVDQITQAINPLNKQVEIKLPSLDGYSVIYTTTQYEYELADTPEAQQAFKDWCEHNGFTNAANAITTQGTSTEETTTEETSTEAVGNPYLHGNSGVATQNGGTPVAAIQQDTKANATVETAKKVFLLDHEEYRGDRIGTYDDAQAQDAKEFFEQLGLISEDGTIIWKTNLMGVAKLELQLKENEADSSVVKQIGYTIMYLGFVIYTILFVFRYLKRLLMLAFLTMIAPLMAMTYPLDKMKDGSAQGFNMWLKEYIFNLLIQPVHLILYTVLIGSAMDLVEQNMLYALAAFGFLLQAEKILRKFFGFDKASTVEGGSALGGALAMQSINHLGKLLGKGGKENKGGNGKNSGNNDTKTIPRKADKNAEKLQIGKGSGGDKSGGQALEARTKNNEEGSDETSDSSEPLIAQQRMVDANDESYGTPDLDAQERDAMARDDMARDANSDDENKDKLESKEMDSDIPEGLEQSSEDEGQTLGEIIGDIKEKAFPKTRALAGHIRSSKAGQYASYIAPKAARLALKGTLAGAGAIAGVAAGLVSDNYANVPKWGAVGAGAGMLAGGGVPGMVGGIAGKISSSADEMYAATHTKDEVEKRQNEKSDRQFLRDEAKIKQYQEGLNVSREHAMMIMKKDAMRYRQAGITDDKVIIKAMKAEGFGADLASKDRINIADMALKVGKDQRKLAFVKDTLMKQTGDKNEVNRRIEVIKKINKDDMI